MPFSDAADHLNPSVQQQALCFLLESRSTDIFTARGNLQAS
jgi:hypothetical protein